MLLRITSLFIFFFLFAFQTSCQIFFAFQDSTTELYGFRTRSKEVKIAPQYHAVAQDELKYFVFVATDSAWIGVNAKGEFLFKAFVVDNGPDMFSEGLCRIIQNGKIGYADTNGKTIIPPQFSCADAFKKGVARVAYKCSTLKANEVSTQTSSEWFNIDKQGNVLNFSESVDSSNEVTNITYKTYYVRISNHSVNASVEQDTITEIDEWLEPYIGWLDVVFREVKSGKMKVYQDKECTVGLTQSQVEKILVKHYAHYPTDELAQQEVPVESKFEVRWDMIQLISFYERWTFTADGKLQKTILSYAPVFEVEDNTTDFPYLKNTLFWVKQ